ncbi:MAG: HAMP domain-containing sensor histidine kinase [Cyanobacteria bacterium]|nr:HAMP domain-containing sensor histidine kinase [Cyanobacteriota bacterium]
MFSPQRLLSNLPWRPPDFRSIRFRLTASVVLASVLGIGGVSGWMIWRMQNMLIEGHRQTIWTLADRFAQDVELYEAVMPTDEALQKVIDHRSLGDMAIWVRSPEGVSLGQSEILTMGSWQVDGVSAELKKLAPGKRLEIINWGDRHFLVCAQPLEVNGSVLGDVFVAIDITQDRQSFMVLTRDFAGVSAVVIVLVAIALAVYVRRSLQPIQAISQQMATATAESLEATRLQLDQAPTEVRELAQTLDQTLARLTTVWEQQRRLLTDVSHELRTPLTLVQGYLQSTLRRCNTLTDIQRDGLETAASEADRTIRILQDLMVLARAGNGHLRLNLERVDLKGLVLEAMEMAEASRTEDSPGEASRRVVAHIEAAPLFVRADANALRQSLVNLIDNALNYSPLDQTVSVRLAQEGDWAVVEVCDRGRGIPLADQVDIFQPFYRVDADRSRATGGTGLGLSIVKTLVEAMQGRIQVRSKLGQGSTFTVQLPI